jgi:MinD-like ATPase involved in chromosome partitioning or flagellar assembly
MGRLILFVIIAVVSFIIAIIKVAIGTATGSEKLKNTTFRGETEKVMDKTAKGIGWMSQQWEHSKSKGATVSEQPMSEIEKALYAVAAEEVAKQQLDQAVMSKAISESDGDKNKAIALYLRYRVAELRQQYHS